MNDKTMARADFFKYIVGKSASFIDDAAAGVVKSLNEVKNVTARVTTKPIISVNDYDGTIKLMTSCNPPLFLIGEPNEDLIAIPALCKRDDFLLSYRAHSDSFYCGVCGETHGLKRSNGRIETDLETISLIVREGKIYTLHGN